MPKEKSETSIIRVLAKSKEFSLDVLPEIKPFNAVQETGAVYELLKNLLRDLWEHYKTSGEIDKNLFSTIREMTNLTKVIADFTKSLAPPPPSGKGKYPDVIIELIAASFPEVDREKMARRFAEMQSKAITIEEVDDKNGART